MPAPHETEHLGRLRTFGQARQPQSDRRHRASRQRVRRALERDIRAEAVAFARWAAEAGLSLAEAATRLGLSLRTLARWSAARDRDGMRVSARGRPVQRSDRTLRRRLLALLGLLGPRTGVPTLQALCPEMARREIQNLLRRYRRAWRHRRQLLMRKLHWSRPGSVWAIDFAEPPQPVEGSYARCWPCVTWPAAANCSGSQ